jgi:hydrogenase maturation factor
MTGKITRARFENCFAGKLGYARKEVRTGPSFGVDVAVVDLPNNQAMALTSDPLSLIPSLGLEASAWLSVHLMANDMATTGHAPMYGQFVLNLPTTLTADDFNIYWNYIHQFCAAIKVAVTGGHTGSIPAQNSTIAGGGTFITIAGKNQLLTSNNARVGDSIIVTKQCAVSSAAILAMSFPETVKSKLGNETYHNACELFYKTSSLQEGLIAGQFNQGSDIVVSAMHDVTEGGVLGAVYEMAVASGNGVLIQDSAIPIQFTVQEVCKLFLLDPRYCIGAGAMLIAVKNGFEEIVIKTLAAQHVPAAVIGVMTDADKGMLLADVYGNTQPLIYQPEDPYWNAFFNALQNNWT